jgi:5-(carboxyamino)imidazole ribonucleotide mutase
MTKNETETAGKAPLVGIVMGSKSDWPTMKLAADMLSQLDVSYEAHVVSAHRTPEWMVEYSKSAESRGLKIIIAGAGGAAHLPGMVASMTLLPVLGVPIQSKALNGLDSLLSIVQMPGGVPVGTMAIGDAGAKNAGLLAARMIANEDAAVRARLKDFAEQQTQSVLEKTKL